MLNLDYISANFQQIQHYYHMQTSQVPPEVFFNHLERIRHTWANKFDGQIDSIILVNGKASAANQKSVAIVSWLFAAYNLTDTILNITRNQIIIFTSQRKITFLNSIKNNSSAEKYNLKFVPKEQNNLNSFQKIWTDLHGASAAPKIGMLIKDAKTGVVAQQFQKFIQKKNYTPYDISHFFNECFVKKDAQQIENIKKSSVVSTYFLNKFIKEIQKVIDAGTSVKHSQLTKNMQQLLSNQAQLKKCSVKLSSNNTGLTISKQFVDVGPAINVQSGGTYSTRLFQQANQTALKSDCIVLGLGALYKSYNSYVGRTLLIDPNEQQKAVYKKILTLCKVIQQNLKPGVTLDQIYEKSVQFMKQHLPQVEAPASFGFGIGVFLVEPLLQITKDNKRIIQIGHSFVISCNFPNLKYQTKNGTKNYCVQIVDTVVVTEKGQQILTSQASTSLSDVSYELGQDQDDQKKQSRRNQSIGTHSQGRPTTRGAPKLQATISKINNQKKRAQHQMELKKKKLQELKQRVNENFIGGFKKQKNIQCSKLQSYKSREDLPKQMKKNQIYVDSKNNTILLPINGRHVPFHIHTLKSVVKNDEGKYSSLRFNFHLPGTVANLTFPRFNQACIYVKQMVFRSAQVARIADLEKQIKTLQKRVKLDLSQKHAKQDIVQQQLIKQNKGKRPILRDLFARPGIGQKKVKGILECHLNGFKYKSSKGQVIDVAFSNIKYAFFQPCEKEIIAAIHFRLHEPILIGKKKSQDIQFYSEGGPNTEDVGGRGRGYGGDDEDDQQRQKQARRKLDKQFKAFMKSCQQFVGKKFSFQTPDRDAGFYGNPFNNNSLLQPTKTCLINVVENRFFIAAIDDIQIACFERMYSNVKSFDMILVMKDYQNFMKISSIPIKDVEKVKDWLDSQNIIFYDQGKNLNWTKFLGIIRKDFKKFVLDGAWMAWDQADQQQQLNQQDQDESFHAQSQSLEDQQSEDSESSSDYANEESSSGSQSEQDLSSEGLSSDELDERAEMEDKEKDRRQMERQRQRQKQKEKEKAVMASRGRKK